MLIQMCSNRIVLGQKDCFALSPLQSAIENRKSTTLANWLKLLLSNYGESNQPLWLSALGTTAAALALQCALSSARDCELRAASLKLHQVQSMR